MLADWIIIPNKYDESCWAQSQIAEPNRWESDAVPDKLTPLTHRSLVEPIYILCKTTDKPGLQYRFQ